ncbi:MAG: phosphomannomutase/phosphoglucomutase [Alphaproteobacteria bacterium PRO2]|nr:phosphomannomutase/phosphoglucomutase [Alphaproteobacteria bacterium PRO2]
MPAPAHTFHPSILREYDIRGEVDKTLSAEDAYALGRAFGTFVHRKGGKSVSVGYDGRLSSPGFAEKLIDGLTATGMDVTAIGLGPTPMLWFAVKFLKTDAGMMVTGSHNPANFNGFKMTLQKEPVYGGMIQAIGDIAAKGDFYEPEKPGFINSVSIHEDYIKRVMDDYTGNDPGTKPLAIAWDCGNGAMGEVIGDIVAKIPGKHTLLHETVDGTFPNHHPDPTVDKNMVDLQKAVRENRCDLGIAFDGDGDRIGVIDENGDILRCDTLLALYAAEIIAERPGAPIIGDVKCSQVMFDEIKRLGGTPVMWKTGHSLVKAKMAEIRAPLAGELSGHIFFADKYYGFDDALYCAVRLINIVARAKGGLSSLTKHLPKTHSTPEIRVDVPEEEKFKIVPQIIAAMKNDKNVELSDIDGIRVKNADGWWLVRPSNTQSCLSVRAEGNSPQALASLKAMAVEELRKLGYDLEFEQ